MDIFNKDGDQGISATSADYVIAVLKNKGYSKLIRSNTLWKSRYIKVHEYLIFTDGAFDEHYCIYNKDQSLSKMVYGSWEHHKRLYQVISELWENGGVDFIRDDKSFVITEYKEKK